MFLVSRPYLSFCPDPKHFIVNFEQNVVKFAEKWGKCIEKCNFYIKYFDKIKCYADRPYLFFSELKPETHIYFWGGLMISILHRNKNCFTRSFQSYRLSDLSVIRHFVLTLFMDVAGLNHRLKVICFILLSRV